jgi:heptosyltransferase-1
MGDIFHMYPAISDLKQYHPEVELHWIVEDAFVSIAEWHPDVDRVIPISLRRWLKTRNSAAFDEFKGWKKELVKFGMYDLVLDAQGLMKSAVISKCVTAKTVHGYDHQSVREVLASFAYKRKHRISSNLHAIEQNRLLMAAALEYDPQGQPNFGLKEIFTPNKTKERNLLFLIGTSKEEKLWHVDRWSELAHLGSRNGYIVELIWGNEKEKNLALEIKKLCSTVSMVKEHLSIVEVAEKLCSAIGVVGLDSGFTHLSGAMEIPTVALFGPTSPDRFGLIGKKTSNLTQMNQLSIDMVWEALHEKIHGEIKTTDTELI